MKDSKSFTALNISSAMLIIALLIIVFLINHFAPLYTDDYLYSFKFNPGFAFQEPGQLNYEKIASPADYFTSLNDIYYNLTGRVVAHGMLQFILLFPPWVFDIINTLALFLMCFLMVRLVVGKDRKFLPPYILIAFSLFYIAAARTVFNFYLAAFSCNYIWTQILTLAFLIPFRNHMDDNNYKAESYFFALLMLVFGIITGNTNEPIIPGVVMFVFFYIVYSKISKIHLPVWIYAAFIGLCIGFAWLIFAPGNAQRLAYESGNIIQPSKFGFYPGNFRQIIYLSLASLPAFLLALISVFRLRKPTQVKDWIPFLAILIILAGILFSLFFVPTLGKRLNILFIGFYVMTALALLYRSKLNTSIWLAVIFLILSPLLALKLVSDYQRLHTASREYRLIDQEIYTASSDSVLVTPRGYLDPITRANWARPIAVHYGLNYLWVHDVLDSIYIQSSHPVSYKSMHTIISSKALSDIDLAPDLRYVNHNDFSRTVYIDFKLDTKLFDPAKLKVYYYSIDITSPFWEKIYTALPIKLRLYLMPDMQEYRDTPYQLSSDGIRFAVAVRNDKPAVDYIRLQVQYENMNIRDFLIDKAEFSQ